MQVNAGKRGLAKKTSNITNLGETLASDGFFNKQLVSDTIYYKVNFFISNH